LDHQLQSNYFVSRPTSRDTTFTSVTPAIFFSLRIKAAISFDETRPKTIVTSSIELASRVLTKNLSIWAFLRFSVDFTISAVSAPCTASIF